MSSMKHVLPKRQYPSVAWHLGYSLPELSDSR
jgi:hypothetical protein